MKYSEAMVKEISKYLESGMNIEDTCVLAGISKETFFTWRKTKSDFSDSTKKAQAKNKANAVVRIQRAGEKQWQALAWWLERKYPEEFALKQNLSMSQTVVVVNGKNRYDKFNEDELQGEFERRRRRFHLGNSKESKE